MTFERDWLDVNETTVIRLNLPQTLAPSAAVTLDRNYAEETAVAMNGEPASFEIGIDNPNAVQSAKLIVGVHRRGGVTEPVSITVNKSPIELRSW